jgi:hypothetical protein
VIDIITTAIDRNRDRFAHAVAAEVARLNQESEKNDTSRTQPE